MNSTDEIKYYVFIDAEDGGEYRWLSAEEVRRLQEEK